jgi:hypothetical protein
MPLRRLRTPLLAAACLIVGVAIGFAIPRSRPITAPPAGIIRPSAIALPGRDVFSPDIRHDAHFIREQRKLLAMLERQCRMTQENCDVARSLRDALTDD